MSRAPMPDSASGETPMPSSFDDDLEFWEEGFLKKLGRRLKEEPLIPVGLGLTCYAVINAARSMRRGDKYQTNRWFRARVYAQAFTLVCVCAGALYWKEDREKRKYYKGLLAEKRSREKRDAWIRELELREEEAERERERTRKRRAATKRPEAPATTGKDANTSPLETAQLRALLFTGSPIIGHAMWLWRGGKHNDGDGS